MSTQKTYTEITPQEALKTLYEAGGMPVGGFAFRDREGHAWMESALSGADIGTANQYHFRAVTGEAFAHCARVTITSPIAAGHNPDGLTESQVGVSEGWRLLTEEENEALRRVIGRTDGIEYNKPFLNDACWAAGAAGGIPQYTYRTKQPAGYYLPKPKTLTPWTFETCPQVRTLVRYIRNEPPHDVWGTILALKCDHGGKLVCCFHETLAVKSFTELLRDYEHSTDSGKTWKPCGTEA